ncbi:MAG: tyrosine-type recombinase/integrase [Syntrophaceae bacterium]|jgi:integrase
MSYSYFGNFKAYIEGLIEQKQLLGYPYQTSSRILRDFDSYCIQRFPDESTITRDIGLGWATLKESEHQNYLLRRITPVRQLAKYMNSIGVEAYIIPPKIPKKQIRYVPHIYTAPELAAFFRSIDMCRPSPFSQTRYLIIPVFFRLLYCCGLRPSEARLLHVSDVDLSAGTIIIRESKGHKDRIVYLSDDLIQLCKTYDEKMRNLLPDREAFFPNAQGLFYNKSTIDCWFHEFWDHLDEAKQYSGNSPRVHDFRHTYAVNRLNQWIVEGKDINAYLPYLSMYLGHVHQADTDYYLHLISEFFPVFREKAGRFSEDLLPEVDYE